MNSNANDHSPEMIIQEEEHEDNEEEPLYVMTVELEKGKSENIKIYSDSKPEELSYEFCKQYNLDFTSLNYLTRQIKTLLDNIKLNENYNQSPTEDVTENSKDECIIEVDEDEILASDTINKNNNNSSSHQEKSFNNSNIKLNYDDDDLNYNDLYSNKIMSKPEDVLNQLKLKNIDIPIIENTEPCNIINTNPQLSDLATHSLFSYDGVYNRIKNKIETKQKTIYYTYNNSTNSVNKTTTATIYPNNNTKINMSKQIISLADNNLKLKEFLIQESKHLDDIYQKKSHSKDIFSNITSIISNGNYYYSNDNQDKLSCGYQSKSHTNSINETTVYQIAKNDKTDINAGRSSKIVPKCLSTQSLKSNKQKNFTIIGERLYKEGMINKGETKLKLLLIKQEIDNKISLKKKTNLNRNNISFFNRNPSKANKTKKPFTNSISYTDKYKKNSYIHQQKRQKQITKDVDNQILIL